MPDTRDQLAEVLRSATHVCQHSPCATCLIVSDDTFDSMIEGTVTHGGVITRIEGRPEDLADALLPTVERIATERAAEALERAGDALHVDRAQGYLKGVLQQVAADLRRRATELRAATEMPR